MAMVIETVAEKRFTPRQRDALPKLVEKTWNLAYEEGQRDMAVAILKAQREATHASSA